MNYKKVADVIKDELHEMRHLNVEIKIPRFNADTYDKDLNPLPREGFVRTKIAKKIFDENGHRIHKYIIVAYENPEAIRKLKRRGKRVSLFRVRVENYLSGMGVPMTEESEFVMTILHEYGHINQIEMFRYHGKYEEYVELLELQEHGIRLVLGMRNMIKYMKTTVGQDLFYNLSYSELDADNFMYINFPRVLNRLRNEGLIEW